MVLKSTSLFAVSVLAIGLTVASGAFAQDAKPTGSSSQVQNSQGAGMMGSQGMKGGMADMSNMMVKMNRMMDTCNNMMDESMQHRTGAPQSHG